jgi:hypothetical protein
MPADIQHGVLCAPRHLAHRNPAEIAQQTTAADAAEHVVMTETDALELAAEQGGADVTDDRFDFGKLGHCS